MTTKAVLEWLPGLKTEEAITFLDRERPALSASRQGEERVEPRLGDMIAYHTDAGWCTGRADADLLEIIDHYSFPVVVLEPAAPASEKDEVKHE